MRKIILILCIATLCGLTACGKSTGTVDEAKAPTAEETKSEPEETPAPAEQAAEETEAIAEPIAEPEPVKTETTIEYVFPEDQANDWQKAYYEKLCELRDIQAADPDTEDPLKIIDSYFLYDIDNNGTPELYVKFGDCEAAYMVTVYSYGAGKVSVIDDIDAGHCSFYSTPDQGLMVYWGHMASEYVELFRLQDGKFITKKLSEREFMDVPDGDYTDAEDLVPGAKYIMLCPGNIDLPIMMYGQTSYNTATGQSEDEVKAAIQKVYKENGNVYGVSGDGYGGDTGMLTFTEYCEPGRINEYMEKPASITDEQWVDLNQDGQVECVLKMQEEGVEDVNCVMLSLQNDTVYAYSFHYWSNDATFHEDGTFDYEYSYYNRIIFDKDQCYAAME